MPKDNNPPLRWVATAGKWSFELNPRYEGPIQNSQVQYGIALSNQSLRDGSVSVKIAFSSLQNVSAGLIVGFRSENAPYVLPQLGGYSQAYAIATFEPGLGWRPVIAAGSINNLRENVPYLLEVEQQGQRIRMAVDTVPVFDHLLAAPLVGSQLGLYAWGETSIDFTEMRIERIGEPRAFVAMPFQEPYETFYREVIKPEAEQLGFRVVRIDEKAGPGIIFEDIKREIEDAQVVITEITSPNQNVFYELGYAHALNKPTVLLAQRGKELPFDIRSYRVIFYDDSIGGKPVVERQLREHLHSILKDLTS
jgi:hypothetical protein